MVLELTIATQTMMQPGLKPKKLLFHFLFGLTFLIGLTVSRQIKREPERLHVRLQAVHQDSVNLIWSCLCNETVKDLGCTAYYWTGNSNNMLHQTFVNTTLNTPILRVNNLKENTNYELYLRCRCCSAKSALPVSSGIVTFTTGNIGAVQNSQQKANIHVAMNGDRSNKSNGYNSSCDHDCKDDQPTFYEEKSPFSSVLDTTLGVVFAVIGVVIAVVAVCYLWKGWQRRRRFPRFLRSSESSDQFDIIQENMEEESA